MRNRFLSQHGAPTAHAHCDAPCGVYDPASARVAGEAVLSMTKKLLDLKVPDTNKEEALLAYHNTMTRYILVKEEQAQLCKDEVLILWTDYFKPAHLEEYPELHTLFWETAKLCSSCKQEVNMNHAKELMDNLEKIHTIFWKTKGRDISWELANA